MKESTVIIIKLHSYLLSRLKNSACEDDITLFDKWTYDVAVAQSYLQCKTAWSEATIENKRVKIYELHSKLANMLCNYTLTYEHDACLQACMLQDLGFDGRSVAVELSADIYKKLCTFYAELKDDSISFKSFVQGLINTAERKLDWQFKVENWDVISPKIEWQELYSLTAMAELENYRFQRVYKKFMHDYSDMIGLYMTANKIERLSDLPLKLRAVYAELHAQEFTDDEICHRMCRRIFKRSTPVSGALSFYLTHSDSALRGNEILEILCSDMQLKGIY